MDANLKKLSTEQIIEQHEGWEPGMRVKFDDAMYDKDKDRVRALLPKVPKVYAKRFDEKIKGILGDKKEAIKNTLEKHGNQNKINK